MTGYDADDTTDEALAARALLPLRERIAAVTRDTTT